MNLLAETHIMIRKIIRISLLLLLLFPILLWNFWLFESKRIINVLIFDKTVLNTKGVEHRSFNWVLNNMKVVKPDGEYEAALASSRR